MPSASTRGSSPETTNENLQLKKNLHKRTQGHGSGGRARGKPKRDHLVAGASEERGKQKRQSLLPLQTSTRKPSHCLAPTDQTCTRILLVEVKKMVQTHFKRRGSHSRLDQGMPTRICQNFGGLFVSCECRCIQHVQDVPELPVEAPLFRLPSVR